MLLHFCTSLTVDSSEVLLPACSLHFVYILGKKAFVTLRILFPCIYIFGMEGQYFDWQIVLFFLCLFFASCSFLFRSWTLDYKLFLFLVASCTSLSNTLDFWHHLGTGFQKPNRFSLEIGPFAPPIRGWLVVSVKALALLNSDPGQSQRSRVGSPGWAVSLLGERRIGGGTGCGDDRHRGTGEPGAWDLW